MRPAGGYTVTLGGVEVRCDSVEALEVLLHTTTDIAADLNERGVSAPRKVFRGKPVRWTRTTVYDLVGREAYKGRWRAYGNTRIDVPAIVDDALWSTDLKPEDAFEDEDDNTASPYFDASPAPDVDGLSRPERQLAWVKAAKAGSRAAVALLLTSTDGLIWQHAKKWTRNEEDASDLHAELQLQLMSKVHDFDESKGAGWSTFAVWWLKAGCSRWRVNHSKTVRVPSHQYKKESALRKVQKKLTHELQRTPTDDELCKETGFSAKKMQTLRINSLSNVSLDTTVSDDTDTSFVDHLAGAGADSIENQLTENQRHQRVAEALDTLTEKERFVLVRRFGIGTDDDKTLDEVGQVLGLSQERVRQIEAKALEKLAWRGTLRGLR